MHKTLSLFFAFGLFLTAIPEAEALVYDAADVLDAGKFSAGLASEILLSNPSSEGIEVRVKYGVTKTLNSQAIIGQGSDYRRFRIGVNNVLSVFPDAEGQVGIGAMLGGLFLKRREKGLDRSVFIATAGPIVHKRFPQAFIPMNAFFAVPLGIELDNGRYFTGSQLVIGAILEFSSVFVPLELGIGIAQMESYVGAGAGIHF